jgi:hypothetical protein
MRRRQPFQSDPPLLVPARQGLMPHPMHGVRQEVRPSRRATVGAPLKISGQHSAGQKKGGIVMMQISTRQPTA